MNNRNICKFIVSQDQGRLIANNFIFESEVPGSGEIFTEESHALYYVCGGEGRFQCAQTYYRLEPGMVFFSFAHVPFMIENVCQLKYYYISFQGGRAEELFNRFGVSPSNCIFEGQDGFLPLWQDSIARANEENIDLLSESLLLYTFSKLKRRDQAGSNLVRFVVDYMEEHFRETTMSLSELAQAAGYNEKYLSHVFKKQFGMGFSEYLRLLRIKYAVMLIENGVTSVKNVAALSGFSDSLYFSKVFTEIMKVSPKQYQKNLS